METFLSSAQLSLIRAGFALIKWTVDRGYQTWVRIVARFFPKTNRATIALGGGVVLSIRLDDPYWCRSLLLGEQYEPEVSVILHALLGPGAAFIDTGANIGFWSCTAAHLIGNRERITAVEPDSRAASELRRNAALSRVGFRIREAAVWRESNSNLLFLERRAHTDSSLAESAAPSTEAVISNRQVPTVALDDLIAETKGEADLVVLKLDLEGAEIEVLNASVRLREEPLVIIYEEHGSDPTHRVSAWFAERGFQVFGLSAARTQLEPVTLSEIARRKTSVWTGYNFVAVQRGREDLLGRQLFQERFKRANQ